jgi:photosystem II stability/assembly factor-like uncharacterized protein
MNNMKRISKFLPAILAVALLGQGCISVTGTGSTDGGVYRSTDRGERWAQSNGVLSVGGAKNINNVSVVSFTQDPSDPQTIYIATAGNGLLFTTDGGASWSQPKDLSGAGIAAIAVDPKNKCVVYAVSGGVAVKTADCTRTWNKIYEESRQGVTLTSVAIDHFNPQYIYIATSKGDIMKSADGGTSWATITAKPMNTAVMKLIVDPADSRIVYAATKSDGIWKTTDGGATWVDMSKGLEQFDGARDFYDLVPDNSKRDSYVLVCRYGLIRTDDGGKAWAKIPLLTTPGTTHIYAFALNPQKGQEMYYSTATVFYKTANGGTNWTTKRLPTSRVGSALLVHAKDQGTVYLGTLVVKK